MEKYVLRSSAPISDMDTDYILKNIRTSSLSYLGGPKTPEKTGDGKYSYNLECSVMTSENRKYLTKEMMLEIMVRQPDGSLTPVPQPFLERVIIDWKKRFSKKSKEQNKRFFDTVITKRRLKPGTLDEEVDI